MKGQFDIQVLYTDFKFWYYELPFIEIKRVLVPFGKVGLICLGNVKFAVREQSVVTRSVSPTTIPAVSGNRTLSM